MSVDLEFAIKQDIRNNPVVREVDTAQKREFLRLLGWSGAIVLMLIVAATPRYSTVATSFRVEDLRQELAREREVQRKYVLELEMLQAPQLIEERAESELDMRLPSEGDTVVLSRVPPPPRPNTGIVAAVR